MNFKMNFKDRLIRYIEARFPIIHIDTFEEDKADEIIKSVAGEMKLLEWNGADGLVHFDNKKSLDMPYNTLEDTLNYFNSSDTLDRHILVIKDITGYIENPEIISLLKSIVRKINNGMDATIIIVSSNFIIPKELEKFITILEIDYLDEEEIKDIISNFIKENELPSITKSLHNEFAVAFKGLTKTEIENILALAYSDNGELTRKDLELIFDQKQQTIKKANILEIIPLKEDIDDIGGLENLKNWLKRKGKIFKNINNALEFGVAMPKGVLIFGVPGCGKSLNAKAAAKLFEVPLLRMDMGRIMGKYVGESETNMRKAIKLAEAISPCVLWIDELEKAFAGIGGKGGDSEVTTRLFGNFLTWMQEKESPTFVVATANDITKLPPELLRKGRFDEIFYVDLPNDEERKKIFEIHISKRRKSDLEKIDLSKLVSETKRYSGADIEGVIKESIETVFADGKKSLTTEDIIMSIKSTHSLYEIMKDSIDEMSKEYKTKKFKNASK